MMHGTISKNPFESFILLFKELLLLEQYYKNFETIFFGRMSNNDTAMRITN
jgi:hypothetical protein